jgi:hypothetical protein
MTSANDGWAVGWRQPAKGSANGNGIDPLLLHFQNNAWSVYNSW